MEVTAAAPQASVVRHTLDTVRVLHDTVLALRQALDTSRQEVTELQRQFGTRKMDDKDMPEEEGEEDVFEEEPPAEDRQDSEEDIDDIELVFTTGDTDAGTINDDQLVSIREEGSTKNMHSVVVETDISKCGVVEELDGSLGRRNTLPTPTPYRPILHRELVGSRRGPVRSKPIPLRPVPKQESGAQTDISALPGQWKSETYLAHKISYNLTTLPSKFTLPVPRASKIPIHDKTQEARRVMLSDINFTSMVPELSRSADHLHKEDDVTQELCKNYPAAFEYMKSFDVGQEGKSPRCCELTRHGSRSSWGSYYGSKRFQSSSTSIAPFHTEVEHRRRHSWRPPTSANTPCCCHHPVWSSVPSSPTRCPRFPPSDHRRSKHRVMFQQCHPHHIHPGQSLPDLRNMDSGDSTDSLIDEADDYLRHQIDALLISRKIGRRRDRRLSEANSLSEFEPPKSSQPFLPRSPRDLKHGYLAKVITGEGRVVVGRVRYSGPVTGREEPHVGVQLPFASGVSDGTFLGHRYFECDEDHAFFVPFKKVVIAWCT